MDDFEDEEGSIVEHVEAESASNQSIIQRVMDGVEKEVVTFGTICQLQVLQRDIHIYIYISIQICF
jgi:hypothetical protein